MTTRGVCAGTDEEQAACQFTAGGECACAGTRNVDYVLTVPAPFAPLTRRGLRALEIAAKDGLEQLEAGTVLWWRRAGDPDPLRGL